MNLNYEVITGSYDKATQKLTFFLPAPCHVIAIHDKYSKPMLSTACMDGEYRERAVLAGIDVPTNAGKGTNNFDASSLNTTPDSGTAYATIIYRAHA